MNERWEAVIGLEIHVQLATVSKLFSGAATTYGAQPNEQACAIDLGMPGTLPVLNAEAVKMAVKFGLAVGGTVAETCYFARKNYFYPDLPKGYQISQYEHPIVAGGSLSVPMSDGRVKVVHLTRAHLEEDAGKSLHQGWRSGIDLNRAGTPLLEIVSEPELYSAQEAAAYMRAMHTLVRYLEICDGNMQEGSFRCDANVSIKPSGSSRLGTRAELKNINSFRFVERAIEFEIDRQVHLLESGEMVVQETRLYDPERNETRAMRSKEDSEDYRYFPDPDLLPVVVSPDSVEQLRQGIPELPAQKQRRYVEELGLSAADAVTLTVEPELAAFYEQTLAAAKVDAGFCANWVLVELMGALHKQNLGIDQSPLEPAALAGLLRRIDDGTISGKLAKQVFGAMWAGQGDADTVIRQQGLEQITDEGAIATVVDEVLGRFPQQIEQYRGGDQKVFNFFVGQVMKATRGKANPEQLRALLEQRLQT